MTAPLSFTKDSITRSQAIPREAIVPTLIRFVIVCAVVVAGVYAGMLALAYLVEPSPRETTIRVPLDRLTNPER